MIRAVELNPRELRASLELGISAPQNRTATRQQSHASQDGGLSRCNFKKMLKTNFFRRRMSPILVLTYDTMCFKISL